MSTLRIELPDELKTFVEEQTARRGHASPSDFIASLVEEDRFKDIGRDVDAMLREEGNRPSKE
jgi:Arc/MetJ-type ribon-helix-helix transcriptional regulator